MLKNYKKNLYFALAKELTTTRKAPSQKSRYKGANIHANTDIPAKLGEEFCPSDTGEVLDVVILAGSSIDNKPSTEDNIYFSFGDDVYRSTETAGPKQEYHLYRELGENKYKSVSSLSVVNPEIQSPRETRYSQISRGLGYRDHRWTKRHLQKAKLVSDPRDSWRAKEAQERLDAIRS